MPYRNTKYITRKISKIKVAMLFNRHAFIFKVNGEYYYFRIFNIVRLETISDAYEVLNNQDRFDFIICSYDELEERSFDTDAFKAMRKIMRETKLKELTKDE